MEKKPNRPNLEDGRLRCASAGPECIKRTARGPTPQTLNELQKSWSGMRMKDRTVIKDNYRDLRGNLLGKKSTAHIHHPRNLSEAIALKPKTEANLNLFETGESVQGVCPKEVATTA